MDREELKDQEVRRRVVYALLTPVTRLAAAFELPVKELTNLVRLSYFRQLRNSGVELKEIADSMDLSVRSVKRLSKQVRDNFFAPEVEHELPRRIEFMLWATSMSRARIAQVLSGYQREEIDEAIDQLLAEERICREQEDSEVFTNTRPASSLVADSVVARLGSLRSFASNVGHAVFGRFFEDDDRSFARTLTFRIRREDLDELHTLYAENVRERLTELEERVDGESEHEELQLSICFAPLDLIEFQ